MSIVVLHEPAADSSALRPAGPGGGAGGTTVHAAPTDVPLTRTFCGEEAEGMSQVDLESTPSASWYPSPSTARICPDCDRAVTQGHWSRP